jgi:hypothetical protein
MRILRSESASFHVLPILAASARTVVNAICSLPELIAAAIALLVAALDAMPDKRLIAHELRKNGEVCALGSVGAARGLDLEALDPEDFSTLWAVDNLRD